MSTKTRICANCAAFHAGPDIEAAAPECWNLVSFVERPGTPDARRRAPGPTDCCNLHQTHQEDAAEARYIDLHRDEIMARIRRLAAEQEHQDTERNQLRDAEVGAERIMQRALARMRKGSTS